jgi:exonuclease III
VDSFIDKFTNVKAPIVLSINIQSLNAKYDNLKYLLGRLLSKNIHVDIIALQEVWNIKHCNLLKIPGFNLCFKNRSTGRGGGVGFYIRDDLDFEIVEPPFSYYVDKIFESLTLCIKDNSCNKTRQYIISSVYRSPSPINNVPPTVQMDNFIENMELLLNFNNNFRCPSFVCLDANINLLDLNNMTSINYYNCLMNCGFIPVNTKATRMQGGTSTFIDHILSNVPQSCKNSGSIIDDLSDHWLTFMQLNTLKSI